MVVRTGLEPVDARLRIWCVNRFTNGPREISITLTFYKKKIKFINVRYPRILLLIFEDNSAKF